jgi:N-hydroxyarylamine O-acetyltransferase
MNLSAYLHRIHFSGTPKPDLATLRQLTRAHLAAIPYEDLDVQLGFRLGFDLEATFDKLVRSRRGGWCYEMNGLLAWALERIGFRYTRLGAAALREEHGDATIGNHLALCVHLERDYLADVGFGDALIEPIPIVEGAVRQDFLQFRLVRLDATWWRLVNHPEGTRSFDLTLEPALDARLAERCEWLQTSPDSSFVQNAVCERYVDGELRVLRGRVMKIVRADRIERSLIESLDGFREGLSSGFDIELADADLRRLWDRVCERHREREKQLTANSQQLTG